MMPAKRATGSLCTELGGLLSMLVRLAIRRWREIVVLLLLASFIIPPAWAEDDASSHITRLENRDYDGINFKGVTEFEISDPDLMPRQLAQAATALHCSYADGIKIRRPASSGSLIAHSHWCSALRCSEPIASSTFKIPESRS
jgi:hypothetical protein